MFEKAKVFRMDDVESIDQISTIPGYRKCADERRVFVGQERSGGGHRESVHVVGGGPQVSGNEEWNDLNRTKYE